MLRPVDIARTTIDEDFHAWLSEQAQLFRRRRFDELDFENMLEELDYLARKERSAIVSNLRVLLSHLLKWRHQASKRKQGWRNSIVKHRRRIDVAISVSPSLATLPAESLAVAYRGARSDAAGETGLAIDSFPEDCPFTIDDALAPDFLPDAVDQA